MFFPLPALLCVALGSHPESQSRSQIQIEGARATIELRFQSLSLLEVLPELDLRHDGAFDAEELAQAQPAIESYLLGRFRLLRVDGEDGDGETEQVLSGTVTDLSAEDAAALGPFDLQNLSARIELASEGPLEVVVVESRLFHETNPWHRDFASLSWNGAAPVPHTFEGSEVRWRFEPDHVRRPGVLARFLCLGGEHILRGGDHLAFLLALLVASRRIRTLLGVATLFTAAQAITLVLVATGRISLPTRLVELAIVLSIAYLACDNLLRKGTRDSWLETGFFGLLHGLGFVSFLADPLAGEPLFSTALVGFSLGVELGQLAVVLVAALVCSFLFRSWRRARAASDAPTGLVPPLVRFASSVVVALLGFYWFAGRAGWLPWA